MCSVYILFSDNLNQYYYGHTCDQLSERIRKHYSNHKGFTGKTDDWILDYFESFSSKKQTVNREMQLKKMENQINDY